MGLLSKIGLLAQSETPPTALTFKNRVAAFWGWFETVAPRFYDTIEAGECHALASEVSRKVSDLLPGLSWVFGPGADGAGHSFTLSAEGIASRRFLTEYWLSQAPTLEGWTFYDARQPGSISGKSISIRDRTYAAAEVWLTPKINAEGQKIDITIWHPNFAELEQNQQHTILFLWLDEALGERGTSRWVGEIRISDQELKGAMPIGEFRDFVNRTAHENGWKSRGAGVIYKLDDPSDKALRADTFVGSSDCFSVVESYLDAGGPAESDPIAGLGAEFVFVALDRQNLDDEDVLGAREKIDQRIREHLGGGRSGITIGGATGLFNAYIDVLIYDGQHSVDQIQAAVKSFDLPYGATIHPFFTTRDPLPIAI